MGGRGKNNYQNDGISERFSWVKDVSTDRLQGYIARSNYLGGDKNGDPQGRSIHVVAYYAQKELDSRK